MKTNTAITSVATVSALTLADRLSKALFAPVPVESQPTIPLTKLVPAQVRIKITSCGICLHDAISLSPPGAPTFEHNYLACCLPFTPVSSTL